MPAKPAKTDRAPKTRWSVTERTASGRAPSHRDGQSCRTPASPAATHIPTLDAPSRGFADLGVPANLVVALSADGISEPFPIQAATIPDALAGKDVLGRGRTGSGKTLAFGLPMISRLAGSASPPRAQPRGLVLVPTRELAMQVAEVIAPLARIAGLSLVLVAGGMPYPPQILAFSRGVDIVVATPGRLIDLMDQGVADLSRIEITVLDEADHMADLGFLPAVSQVLDTVPDRGQRLLFSATLDKAIDRLVCKYLHEPVVHQVDTGQASVPLMSHHLVSIAPQHKAAVTAEIASRPGRTLIFVRTQRGADRVAEQLRRSGVLAGALHGGLAQGARTRIMSAFKHGSLPVLVATDVAARGIHVDEVGLVLHADPPNGPKEYLHRAGRTARAGGMGAVVTFALPHQRHELGRLTTQAGVRPVMLSAIPGDRALAAATGARRASGDAISHAAYQRVIGPPPAQRSHSARGRRGDSGVRGPGRSGRRRSPGSTGVSGSRSRRVP
jgi:superfamily II DNA/RNA helicase